jgi:hypothetical protein
VETQSNPPYDGGSDIACSCEVDGELVVSCCDAAPVLETAEHAFDDISSLIGLRIERLDAFAGWIVWDDGAGSSLNEEAAKGIAVIGSIGCA